MAESEAIAVTVTGRGPGNVHEGLCVPSRAADEGWCLLLFASNVCLICARLFLDEKVGRICSIDSNVVFFTMSIY